MSLWRRSGRVACVLGLVLAAACQRQGDTAAAAVVAEVAGQDAEPLQISTTRDHELIDPASGRKYHVWVDLPVSYDREARSYPVVFVTDARLWFLVVRGLGRVLSQGGQNVEQFILVGLAGENGADFAAARARDLTPSDPRRRDEEARRDYGADAYGEAGRYRDYVEKVVFPFISSRYRADMRRTVYMGHSYGGLFGAYTLLTRPQMFQSYLLGSPSLWFDRRYLFEFAREQLAGSSKQQRRVMIVAGGYETIWPGPRYFKTVDIVRDAESFAEILRAASSPGSVIVTEIMPGEDHFTVFPSLISRGLLWALPGFGPYKSG